MSKPMHILAQTLCPTVETLRRFGDNALLVNQQIAIYLFERCPYQDHVENLLTRNTAQGLYSLFIVDGAFINIDAPDDDLNAAFASFHAIYPRKCYVYHLHEESFIVLTLPYQRQAAGLLFGAPLKVNAFCCETIGAWKVATFEAIPHWQPRPKVEPTSHERPYTYRGKIRGNGAEQRYFDLLGIEHSASEEEVKQAYRRLAQAFHPDLNPDPNATDQMQAINEAYRAILRK